MNIPCALFVGSSELSAVYVIEKVLNGVLPESSKIDNNIIAYQWHLDNKYYTTDINLCSLNTKAIGDVTFASSVEAVVICFDSNNSQGLETAESWLPFLDVYDADIKILVCGNCQEDVDEVIGGVCKRSALEWCVQRGFELVELDPNTEEIDDEDDFPETTGVERIRQALNAHQWPNLVLKSERNSITTGPSLSEQLTESLEELLEEDDFGNLFSQLPELKARVAALSGREKEIAALQVVSAFWKAMRGDDEDPDILNLDC